MAGVRKIKATIRQITPHGEGVYTLALTPEKQLPRFDPGQFLHLAIDPYDPTGFWPESRVFSIASSPERREEVTLCYSTVGRFTKRMEQELAVGREVWLKLPYGEFTVSLARETVLLAGGTGFTAFAAFLERLSTAPHPLHVVYGARTEKLLIFGDLVRSRAAAVPGVDADIFLEREAVPAATESVRYHAGRIDLGTVWSRLTQPLDCDFYIAGPPAMIEALKRVLAVRGVKPERVLVDAWS
ncbi:MAG: ferredoxin--NADP reductase [Planctomycetota bacterium]